MAELLAANQITIAKVLDGEKGDKGDKGEMSAEQLAQLNQASEDASQAKSDVANLEIGGRNLVTNSVNLSDFSIESSTYITRTITDDYCIVNRLVNANKPSTHYGIYKDIPVTAGEEYTVSCTVKEITGIMRLGLGHDTSKWTGLGVWNLSVGRFSRTLTAPSNATFIRIYIAGNDGVNGGSVTVSNIKLEIGNKATDWTPAPEDVDAGIKDAAKVATNFINYDSTNGLVLGNKESGSWVGYRTQIDNDSFNVLDENGNIIASYGSNEVELGKGNPNAIIKMCDGKAYVKNYVVGSQNTSVFCGQDVTVVGEWEGASESYALFKQGFVNIGQSGSHIIFTNETDNENHIEIQGQNITMRRVTNVGDFNCYMDANFKCSVTIATPLPISSGGTGATTAAAAVSNLGINDYIVEEGAGTDSGSYYRKWASGRAEYWHKFNPGAYTIGTARGNMYSGAYFDSSFESGLFNAVPQVNCYAHLSTDAYVIGTQVKTISKDSVTLRLWASGSIASNSGYNVHIYAFGTWK